MPGPYRAAATGCLGGVKTPPYKAPVSDSL